MTGRARRDGRVASVVLGVLVTVGTLLGASRPAVAAPGPPSVRAPAAILVEPATGDVVFQRRAASPRSIASTTKLMTALVVLERERLGRVVSATRYRALPAESVVGLRAGERLTIADLLRALLLASANDAAATLAARVGGSRGRFVALMNRRARELGLRHTRFANPVGLDETGNHSTAEDLVKLTLILRANAFFRRVTDLPAATLRSGGRPRTVVNRNRLVRTVPEVNGVKTGRTQRAGYVLVGSATRAGVTVISVVLGDSSEAARDADTLALLRHGLRRYTRVTALRRGQTVRQVALAFRDETVALTAQRTVRRTIRRGERVTRRVVGLPTQLDGPLAAGTRVATVELRWRGRTIERVGLVTARRVEKAGALARLDPFAGRTLAVLAIALVALASLRLLLARRRAQRRARRHAGETEVA